MSLFDSVFEPPSLTSPTYHLTQELANRLRIERFCDRVSKALHFASENSGDGSTIHQTSITNLLNDDLFQIEMDLANRNASGTLIRELGCNIWLLPAILIVHLRCAQLHLRLYALFSSTSSENYIQSLLSLYDACKGLLSSVLDPSQDVLSYCPNYVFQMTLASGFTLLKLITSPVMQHLEGISAKTTFNSAIVAVRRISVSNNDLPGRLADVLAQLKARNNSSNTSGQWQVLDLKVRSRMSMSVTYDSLWHWRKGFEVQQSTASTGRQIFLRLPIQHG